MSKNLSEMSLEELWQLFPVIIKEYNPAYKDWYMQEASLISSVIGNENIERITHIGSTAVPGLHAKPTVDILLEIKDSYDTEKLKKLLLDHGYIFSAQPKNPPPHMMFNKGYTPEGFAEKVFHLHVRYSGDWPELYFRDYLLLDKNAAEAYGRLKQELCIKFKHDRDAYTEAKTLFIKEYTRIAEDKFRGRYMRTE